MGLEKITEIRKTKKMTLEDLANKSGVPISTLKKISSGVTTNPNLDTVQAIAKALDCTLDDFDDTPKKEKYNYFLFKVEKELIESYRQLDSFGQRAVGNTINTELKRVAEQSNIETEKTYTIAARGNSHMQIDEKTAKALAEYAKTAKDNSEDKGLF